LAAWKEKVEMPRLLRAAGSWFHRPQEVGGTALHYVAIGGSAPAAREL
jgi:hypothetical protein